MDFSTIAAISTPHGKGGVALLRVSGTDSFSIAARVFRPMNGKGILEHPFRQQIYGRITSADGDTVLDDGLLTCFCGPASFTGEDVVEIACHGGEMITTMILSALLEAGATLATPGEFSRRAFMNGKMSLTAAEGIADLLDAKTEQAALLSSKAARGQLSAELEAISDSLLSIASSLWAYLDYPEEDLQALSDDQMILSLQEVLDRCHRLLESYKIGRAVNSGVSAVIVGKPNVGKSSFFNRLLGEEKAIVTSIPGTTRDVIEYPLKMGRVLLNLSDTAGVRDKTADCVEGIGVERALAALKQSEIVFFLLDSSSELTDEDHKILNEVSELSENTLLIPVLTKSDLDRKLDLASLPFAPESYFVTNHNSGDFTELIDRIERHFISDESALREGRVLTNARQKSDLIKGMELLEDGIRQIASGQKDLASLTLENALSAFLEIDGKQAGERILNEVFSRFCIGK